MKRFIFCLFFSINTLFAQNWKTTQANISFKIKHAAGFTADGTFKGFEAAIGFDPNDLSNANIKATIAATTIDTDNSIRDKEMRSKSYFDVDKYPKITMVATKIEKSKSANSFVGFFNLTIKNTTKAISVPFTFVQETGNMATVKANFLIDRIEYGVGSKSFLLSNTAQVSIVLKVQK